MSSLTLGPVSAPHHIANAAVMGGSASYADLLSGLRGAAQSGGSAGVSKFLINHAASMKGLLSSEGGRIALAAAMASAVGFVGGYKAGEAWPQIQATAAGLRAVYDRPGSATQKARDTFDVLAQSFDTSQAAWAFQRPADTTGQRRVQSLQTSIRETADDLAEALELRERSPYADDALDGIIEAKTLKLEALVNALPSTAPAGPASKAGTGRPKATPDASTRTPPPTPLPATEARRTDAPARQKTQREAEAITRREQAAFVGRLDAQAAGSRTANVATVKAWVQTLTLPQLKEQVGVLRQAILHPVGSHVYQDTEVNGTKPPQAGNPDYIQISVPGAGRITVKDAKAMARMLETYIAGVERSRSSEGRISTDPVRPAPPAPQVELSPAERPPNARRASTGAATSPDAWIDRSSGRLTSARNEGDALPIRIVDALPGLGRRVVLWVDPASGEVGAHRPTHAPTIALAAEIVPSGGGEIVVHVEHLDAQPAGGGSPTPGRPGGPKGPKLEDVLKYIGLAAPTLLFLQIQLDQISATKTDLGPARTAASKLIDGLVDSSTSRRSATGVRDQVWTGYLDAAMASLRQARQGGVPMPRFSNSELADLQTQVDAFKSGLDKAPALAPGDIAYPSLRFVLMPVSDYNKKNEAAADAFRLVNELASADTQRIAARVFGIGDAFIPIKPFDTAELLFRQPALALSKDVPPTLQASAEREIWQHYLGQLPALMKWPEGPLAAGYGEGLQRWLGNGANFERDGRRLPTSQVAYSPPVVLDPATSQQLDLKLVALAERARQDVNTLRDRALPAGTPRSESSALQQLLAESAAKQRTEAQTAGAPFKQRLESVRASLKAQVPDSRLPASTDLPSGRGSVPQPAARALRANLQGADNRLITIEGTLRSLRADLAFSAQGQQGGARTELLELMQLVDFTLTTVLDLRSQLRARASDLAARAASPGPRDTPPAPSPLEQRPLPEVVMPPFTPLPGRAQDTPAPTRPTPLALPIDSKPVPGITPMPLPSPTVPSAAVDPSPTPSMAVPSP